MQCQLCLGKNSHIMQYDKYDRKNGQQWCWDYSYRFPALKHQELEVSTVLAIDPWLEEE